MKNILLVLILIGAVLILYKTLIPVHFLEYNTPYFTARFPGEPYHTVKDSYDLWDVSTADSYYFVYVNKLDSTMNIDSAAEDIKQNFIKNMNKDNKLRNEEFTIPLRFSKSSYVNYLDDEGVYWRFVFVVVPENNVVYQIGVSSKKVTKVDLGFFLDTFKIKSI